MVTVDNASLRGLADPKPRPTSTTKLLNPSYQLRGEPPWASPRPARSIQQSGDSLGLEALYPLPDRGRAHAHSTGEFLNLLSSTLFTSSSRPAGASFAFSWVFTGTCGGIGCDVAIPACFIGASVNNLLSTHS